MEDHGKAYTAKIQVRIMSQGIHFRASRSCETRQNRCSSRIALSGPTPKSMFDKFAILPIAACAFALIVAPLLIFQTDLHTLNRAIQAGEARPENRIFWPAMTAIFVVLTLLGSSRLSKVTWPPHIICLFAYLAFAGASGLWAYQPEISFIRFVQEVMIVTSIVLPAMLASRTADMMRGLFLCFAFALILNVFFVLQGSSTIAQYGAVLADIGYQGYFEGKNYLGECAAVALLLSFHESLYPGRRRVLGIVFVISSITLVYLSNSKTALGLAVISPPLALLTLFLRRTMRISPAIVLLSIPFCYIVLSSVKPDIMNHLSYMLYGDSTFTGRTIIWDFAQSEIERSPLVGWGYRSFWLVPNSLSSEAPGFVKWMPNAHNGYVDTKLEMGYVGLAFLVVFIIATLHAIGRVADRDPARARLLLSLALFIIVYNFLESLWMRGFEFLWVVFLIVAAETARYWGPFPVRRAADSSRSPGMGSISLSSGARRSRLRVGLS
jgi:exopolysaccharide production protein ExoQ